MNAAEAKQIADDFHAAPEREYERVHGRIKEAAAEGLYKMSYSYVSSPVGGRKTVKYVLDKLEGKGYRYYILVRQYRAVIEWGDIKDE